MMSAGQMSFTTDLEAGTKVRILLNAATATSPISIDWGNGVDVKYTVDPSQAAYNRWIEGSIEGESLIIKGNVTEADINEIGLTSAVIEDMTRLTSLDLSKNKLTDFRLVGVTPLTELNLSYNDIVNSTYDNTTLSLENAGTTLTRLSIAHNSGIVCLDMRDLEVLEYLSANDCPKFGSIFICMPEDSRKALRSIDISNCDLAHFYPVSLPNLRTLNLANNSLMTAADDEPFVLGSYPELVTIDVSNNTQIRSLDMTGCTKLENININGNQFTSIDLSQAPDLAVFNAADNNLASLDLGNNKQLRTINVSGNPIKEIDFMQLKSLQEINISRTNISRATLMNCSYLKVFKAAETNIEFIDFNGQQAERMTLIDLRDNKKMTPASMNYTLRTLPVAKSSTYGTAGPNLLISGSNGETANTSYATSSDMKWVCDVTGDGTAKNDAMAVTLSDATDTGENKTGHLDRLYPIFAMGLDYDLDIYSTSGGEFLLAQWSGPYYQQMTSVTTEAKAGVPIYVYTYPEEGKRFKSVTVNGTEIYSPWFMIDGPSTIKVNFTSSENAITLTTKQGQKMSFLVNTVYNNGTVSVDWGTGTRTEYPGQNAYTSGYAELKGTRIDGTAAGTTVTVYGDVAGLDVSGFGDVAEYFGLHDNAITAIDLGASDDLKFLNIHWNPITTIDLKGVPNLEVLDIGYTALKSVDLSGNPNIMWLDAYSDGYGDEEEGIAQLSSIDVSGLKYLQYLDVKGNKLTSLDLSKNQYLTWLNANNNAISAIDISANTMLKEVELNKNKLTSIDVSKATELMTLSLADNLLTSVDVSANPMLVSLSVSGNDIHKLDVSACPNLRTLYINGNGMTADELNDIYYLLPQRAEDADDDQNKVTWNLAVIQGGDTNLNDGNRADSSIALDRGWTPSHTGSNGGSEYAYLDILPSSHGTVKVTDAAGKEYAHGSKVPKYTALTINATPEEGYRMASFTLNGEDAMTGTAFDMPGIYTKLRVTFARAAGIDEAAAAATSISAAAGCITVSADKASVSIYTADGRAAVSAADVESSAVFFVAPGLYIVRAEAADGTQTAKVIVK